MSEDDVGYGNRDNLKCYSNAFYTICSWNKTKACKSRYRRAA
jgi:hypothetical protein